MIKISDLTIQFSNLMIYNDTSFEAYSGQITVISGPSGSGKSTLMKNLALYTRQCKNYTYDTTLVSDLSNNEIEQFIFNNIAFMDQNLDLMMNLTVQEQINMAIEMYQTEENIELINKLNLQVVLNNYPKQLSLGQRVRVAFLLAILKQPTILLLDEPTASLDELNTKTIISLCKEYANMGNLVIIASHDQEVINQADRYYTISNQQLVLKKQSVEVYQKDKIRKGNKPTFSGKYFIKMLKYRKKSTILMMIILAIAISFAGFSTSYNNYALNVNTSLIKELETPELLVFKSAGGKVDNVFSNEGDEDAFSKEEYQALKEIPHINKINDRFDYILSSVDAYFMIGNIARPIIENDEFFNIIKNNQVITPKDVGLNSVEFHTYQSSNDYSKTILKQFDKEGVYISYSLAKTYFDNFDDFKNVYVEFDLYVPVYNAKGISQREDDSDGQRYEVNHISCEKERVTLPIAGILNGTLMSVSYTNSQECMYISYSTMNEYINKYRTNQANTQIFVDDYWYENELPNAIAEKVKNNEISYYQKVDQTPWNCNSYTITIDDIVNIKEVINSVQEKGFDVYSNYIEVDSIRDYIESSKKGMQSFSVIIMLIITLLYVAIKYNNQSEEQAFNRYLYKMGITKKQLFLYKLRKYGVYTILLLFISLACLLIEIFLANALLQGHTAFSLEMIVVVSVLVIFIECCIPLFMDILKVKK